VLPVFPLGIPKLNLYGLLLVPEPEILAVALLPADNVEVLVVLLKTGVEPFVPFCPLGIVIFRVKLLSPLSTILAEAFAPAAPVVIVPISKSIKPDVPLLVISIAPE
jgi:hypothetical protein